MSLRLLSYVMTFFFLQIRAVIILRVLYHVEFYMLLVTSDISAIHHRCFYKGHFHRNMVFKTNYAVCVLQYLASKFISNNAKEVIKTSEKGNYLYETSKYIINVIYIYTWSHLASFGTVIYRQLPKKILFSKLHICNEIYNKT